MSKVVVVDDVYAELQLIEGYLKSANHTVVSYLSADNLEEKLANDRPDLIILDVIMPGRNGFQVCRDLKSDERFKNIPVMLAVEQFEAAGKDLEVTITPDQAAALGQFRSRLFKLVVPSAELKQKRMDL